MTTDEFYDALAALVARYDASGPTKANALLFTAIAIADTWSIQTFQRPVTLEEFTGVVELCFIDIRSSVLGVAAPPKGGIQS